MKSRVISEGGRLSALFFWAGFLAVLVMLVPYMILGEDAVVVYHDQLDGEMIAYMLQAKHLLHTGGIPEFMGGMPGTALIPPAPLFVLLFLTGHYFAALVAMQLLGSMAGYVGIYLMGRDLTGQRWIGTAVGVLFAYLPFLPVYGLSQYGIPLLVWCFLQLREGRHIKRCYAYICLYGLCSSLVLVGFAVLLILAVLFCWQWMQLKTSPARRAGYKGAFCLKYQLPGWLLLLAVYILENAALLLELLGISGAAVSHKAEYTLHAGPFFAGWLNAFLKGGQHSEDSHLWILAAAVAVLVILWAEGLWSLRRKGKGSSGEKRLTQMLLFLLGMNGVLAFLAAFWGSSAGIALRSRLGALKGFQLDRVLWVAPACWYLAAVCVIGIAWDCRRRFCPVLKILTACIVFLSVSATGAEILLKSNLKPNLQKLLRPDYDAISYSDYYALGVMDQVSAFLQEETGLTKEEYRVVSLGIDPAAAYYEGFYCLDGYSNNYSLEYKHSFRRAIAPELAKNEYLTENFDGWGNRLYLFSSECPGYYTVEKGGFFFQDYEVDAEALYEMGARYLLSAAYIQDSQDIGLSLMREEPFETAESYYRIFVYEILPKEGEA